MKAQEKSKQIALIDELVKERKRAKATGAIQSFLRGQRYSAESVFYSLEAFRRLGEIQRSLRLLAKQSEQLRKSKHAQLYYFWLARTLNSAGASPLVLPLLEKLHPQSSQEWQMLGDLHLATFEYERAKDCFSKALAIEENDRSRFIQKLAIADSESGLGHNDEAIRLAREAQATTQDSYLQAVCLSAIAEYQALQGDYKSALKNLEAAKFPTADDSPDQAIYQKWKGFVLANLGKRAEGVALLKSSIELFRKLYLRDEMWVLALQLLAKVEDLPREELNRILYWPGLPQTSPNEPAVIGDPQKARFTFYPNSDEYRHDGKLFLGTNRELSLLCYVAAAGAYGLGLYRAISLIWPDRPHEIPQHLKRLNQLTIRLKKTYGFSIKQDDNRLYLSPADLQKVAVVRGPAAPSLVMNHGEFSAKEARDYYSIRGAGAFAKTIARWTANGWIEKSGPRYRSSICSTK